MLIKKIMTSVIILLMIAGGCQTLHAHCIETICESREGHHCVEDPDTTEWKCSSGSRPKSVDHQEKAPSEDSSEDE